MLTPAAWAAAQAEGVYTPPELARDGFLHCCTPAQLDFVLRTHFPGRTDVLVLSFDAVAVGAPLEWATSEPGMDPFPHLYGPIPVAAVIEVRKEG